MSEVSHTDIPVLYHEKKEEFFLYAIMDVIATTQLYFKDRFDAIELFMELEELVYCPWNLSVCRQKTMSANTTTFVQFHSNGFLRKAKLKPKRLLANAVVDEICEYFCRGAEPTLDESVQMISDFCNGHCKCNTAYKRLQRVDESYVLTEALAAAVGFRHAKSKKSDDPFSTVDVIRLVHYLTRSHMTWEPFEELMKVYSERVARGCPKKMDGFKNYLAYLVRLRTVMSTQHETPDLLWKEYKENYKTDSVLGAPIKAFVDVHHAAILEVVGRSRMLPKPMSISPQELSAVFKNKVAPPEGIKLKMLPYDGALIICPKPKIAYNSIVSVFDFRSQYPNGMLAINLGIDTGLSVEKVLQCVEIIMRRYGLSKEDAARKLAAEFVHVCFTRRADDEADWTHYVKIGDTRYLKRNCVFFARNVKFIQNHQFKAEIDSRVVDKFKAEDQSLSKEERMKRANMSGAKKININSRYGVIGSTISPRLQPAVTGVGRRSIKGVTKALKRLLGTEDMYGDTDSCFTYIPDLDVFEMARMTPREIYEKLRFEHFDTSFETFKTQIYDKHFPIPDPNSPKCIRESCGRVVHALYEILAPILSTDALELEAEKTLTAMALSSMKKYTAHNCCTKKTLTKGLSLHNKSAIPLTRVILKAFNEIAVNCWNEWDAARDMYNYLGKFITVPIELSLVDPGDIAKPASFDIGKVTKGSKRANMLTRLKELGVCFICQKLRIMQVTTYPEGGDEDWSLCDILNQSCDGKIHATKVKFDTLNEILGILSTHYSRGVCTLFEALIWGEFYPDKFISDDFRDMSEKDPAQFKPMSFKRIVTKKLQDIPIPSLEEVEDVADAPNSTCTAPPCPSNTNTAPMTFQTSLHRWRLGPVAGAGVPPAPPHREIGAPPRVVSRKRPRKATSTVSEPLSEGPPAKLRVTESDPGRC